MTVDFTKEDADRISLKYAAFVMSVLPEFPQARTSATLMTGHEPAILIGTDEQKQAYFEVAFSQLSSGEKLVLFCRLWAMERAEGAKVRRYMDENGLMDENEVSLDVLRPALAAESAKYAVQSALMGGEPMHVSGKMAQLIEETEAECMKEA